MEEEVVDVYVRQNNLQNNIKMEILDVWSALKMNQNILKTLSSSKYE